MTKFQKLANFAASAAATLLVAAGAAHAATIATISGNVLVGFHDLHNVSTGPFAGGESLTGTGSNIFSFTVMGLPVNLHGLLTFSNAGTLSPATQTTSGGFQTITQGGYTGSFTETYRGQDQTVDGVTLVQNVTTLLSGTFDNGVLTGINSFPPPVGVGGTFDADVTSYSSPFAFFGAGGVDLNLVLSHGSTAWALAPGNTVKTVTTTATGTFSAAVPEPAAWSLMLVGAGMLGAGLRRRRSLAATA
jgi:hypothetical protein